MRGNRGEIAGIGLTRRYSAAAIRRFGKMPAIGHPFSASSRVVGADGWGGVAGADATGRADAAGWADATGLGGCGYQAEAGACTISTGAVLQCEPFP